MIPLPPFTSEDAERTEVQLDRLRDNASYGRKTPCLEPCGCEAEQVELYDYPTGSDGVMIVYQCSKCKKTYGYWIEG